MSKTNSLTTSKVTELLHIKIKLASTEIENLELKILALQQAGQKIVADREALIGQARIEVEAPEDHLFNLSTGEFQAPGSTNED